MSSNKKWYTIIEYVDVNTGEVISKSKFEREYLLKESLPVEIINNRKLIRYLCIPNNQIKLNL